MPIYPVGSAVRKERDTFSIAAGGSNCRDGYSFPFRLGYDVMQWVYFARDFCILVIWWYETSTISSLFGFLWHTGSDRCSTWRNAWNLPWVGNDIVLCSIRSCRCSATPSIADTSTLFLSRVLISALAFLVPNASPRAAFASMRCFVDTGVGLSPLRAFTWCVRRCNGAGRRVVVPVRRLCKPMRYLCSYH